jgi:alanine-glyoxylate transaminase/serine-glyoxylate transaminase/serine-pyruvate transaminase
METIKSRGSSVQSWYLDVNLLANYWGEGARVYHHTAPITMNYALHEALRLTLEEGLENRWARHEANHLRLRTGLAELGLDITSQEGHQLWQLNAVSVPEGADEPGIRTALLNEYQIEVGPGLGPLQGKVWRIGLMGHSSSEENVDRVLAALKALL